MQPSVYLLSLTFSLRLQSHRPRDWSATPDKFQGKIIYFLTYVMGLLAIIA